MLLLRQRPGVEASEIPRVMSVQSRRIVGGADGRVAAREELDELPGVAAIRIDGLPAALLEALHASTDTLGRHPRLVLVRRGRHGQHAELAPGPAVLDAAQGPEQCWIDSRAVG